MSECGSESILLSVHYAKRSQLLTDTTRAEYPALLNGSGFDSSSRQVRIQIRPPPEKNTDVDTRNMFFF